jgi:hypothetical protein
LGQRSRKRGRRHKPNRAAVATAPRGAGARRSSADRDAAVRTALVPFAPGERPWSIKIGAVLAALIGGVQLALFVFGVKLKVAGSHPAAGSTIVFGVVMFVCAVGMWLMRYWAVLGFMALLALILVYFSLALIKASSLLGFVIAVAGVCIAGLLFYRLIRVLSRIQMPRYPGS